MRTLTVVVAVAALALGAARAQTDDARDNAITDRYLTTVPAALTSKVDTRNAAPGQEVTAKTEQACRLADGTELPAGTKLAGHIVKVQAQDKENGRTGSLLALIFDHAELKGGQALRLRVVMQAVAPVKPLPPSQFATRGASSPTVGPGMGPGMGDDGMGAGPAGGVGSGGGMGTGSAGGGGGGSGQAGGMGAGGVGPSTGGIGGSGPLARTTGSIGRLPGSVGDTASSTVGASTRTTGSPVVQAGESVSRAPRMTGLPGVWMSMTAAADASGTLIAYDQNIALDAGTQLTLGVIAR